MIPGPPADILTSLRAGLSNGTPKIALANAEQSIRIYIFWFDLQKIANDALTTLGFSDCAFVVLSQTAEMTHRWPLITSLSFNDGTPFASSETIQWLRSASAASQPADSVAQEALSPADLADPAQALSKLSSPSGRLGDGRSKFIKRLAEIQLWRLNGNVQTAAGLADYLIGEIDSFGLESFEPNLAVQGFKAAYEAYQSAGPQYIDQARKAAVRLALLSPLEALTLKP
jgi:type VI secretion system protein VasJ